MIQNQKKIVNRPTTESLRDIPTVATDDDNTDNTNDSESEVEDIDYRAIFANRNGGLFSRRRENNEQ